MFTFLNIILFPWTIIQNLCGSFVWLYSKIFRHHCIKKNLDGVTYFEVDEKNPCYGVSLGWLIFLRPSYANRITVHHEKGHSWQSLLLGPLYLIIIGIPSGLSNTKLAKFFHLNYNTEYEYYNRWWERTADNLEGIKHKNLFYNRSLD